MPKSHKLNLHVLCFNELAKFVHKYNISLTQYKPCNRSDGSFGGQGKGFG